MEFKHLGIFVFDLDRQVDFYTRVLKLPITDRGVLDAASSPSGKDQEIVFLSSDPEEHHQLILVSGRPRTLSFNPINQISFRVPALSALRDLRARLHDEAAQDIQPISHGNSWSLYARDPEDNRLEFDLPSPFYVDQPFREPLDLALSDADILCATRARCEGLSGFMSREAWIDKVRKHMPGA